MKLELAMPGDADQLADWCRVKLEDGYDLAVDDFAGATVLKVQNAFYIPVRKAMFLGSLIPAPAIDGTKLTVALHRMVKDMRKTFDGEIVYLNYEENGVDAAARQIGGFEPLPGVTITTRHGLAQLMVQRGSRV